MVTAIFKKSKYTVNSFIYSRLIFNNTKRTYSKKSLMRRDRWRNNANYLIIIL